MKTLNEYLKMPYRMEVVEDPEEGGFVVSYPDLPGCITCGETMESAIANAKDAQKAWLEAALEDGIKIPGRTAFRIIPGSSSSAFPAVCIVLLQSIPKEKGSA